LPDVAGRTRLIRQGSCLRNHHSWWFLDPALVTVHRSWWFLGRTSDHRRDHTCARAAARSPASRWARLMVVNCRVLRPRLQNR